MPPTAAPPRSKLDDAALAEELETQKGTEDDGLGPDNPPVGDGTEDGEDAAAEAEAQATEITEDEFKDPNSEYNTGVPGGRQPGDDGYVDPDAEPPSDEAEPPSPPTPPAELPGEGEPDEDPQDEQPADPPLALIGDRELGLKVGGRKPDSATLHLKGGKIELTGPKGSQFNRGDRFLTVSTLQVTGDADNDTIVKTSGEVTSASKKQSATLCGIARLEDWVGERLRDKGLSPKQYDLVWNALELEPDGD